MPYRRLPNTDSERFAALRSATLKAAAVPAADLAFSATTKTQLDALYPGSLPGSKTEPI